jgi:hypothetical protein
VEWEEEGREGGWNREGGGSKRAWRETSFFPVHSSLSRGESLELLKRWFVESKGTVNVR